MFAITTIALAAPTGPSIEMQARHQRFDHEPGRQRFRQHGDTTQAEQATPGAVVTLNKQVMGAQFARCRLTAGAGRVAGA